MKQDYKRQDMVINEGQFTKKIMISFSDLGITTDQLEKKLCSLENDDKFMFSHVEKVFKEIGKNADIRAEYHIFSNIGIDEEDKSVYIGEVRFNVGKIIFPQIKNSEYFALFLCTAGKEISRQIAAVKDSDMLLAYIYDSIGSEIVERAADIVQEELQNEAVLRRMNITNRYSPGYCRWNVAEQHKLFSFFPYNFCGISLTPSALMNPVKSVSGIIGIGGSVKRNPYNCRICDIENCIYRNGKHSEEASPI